MSKFLLREYYVYEFRDLENNVFYVGKGTKSRIRHNGTKETYLYNKIQKIGKKKIKRIKVKKFYGLNAEDKAYKYECFLINYYGLENLCNVFPGGGIGVKYGPRPEHSIKMSGKGNPMYGVEPWCKGIKRPRHSIKMMGKNNPSKRDDVRHKISVSVSGEKNGMSKLTWKTVKKIRKDYASGNYSQVFLSKKYKIGKMSISLIVRNKQWVYQR